MAPIVLTLVQAGFLLLLYLFVWRVARLIVRDLRGSSPHTAAPAALHREDSSSREARTRDARPAEAARPSKRSIPRELVVHRSGGAPRVYALDSADISFGRAEPSTVLLDDPYVSDRHARVWRDGIDWVISDLGSTNGTFLNRVKVSAPTPLAAGDQLGIGQTVVEVRK